MPTTRTRSRSYTTSYGSGRSRTTYRTTRTTRPPTAAERKAQQEANEAFIKAVGQLLKAFGKLIKLLIMLVVWLAVNAYKLVRALWIMWRSHVAARAAAKDALLNRADQQHQWVLVGDDRGIYGDYTPATSTPAPGVSSKVAEAVNDGLPGRGLGWWKVEVDSTGHSVWTQVDGPGDGPRMTVQQAPGNK
jgi:hypothetical protein